VATAFRPSARIKDASFAAAPPPAICVDYADFVAAPRPPFSYRYTDQAAATPPVDLINLVDKSTRVVCLLVGGETSSSPSALVDEATSSKSLVY
jgi:hypothetical protein